MLVPLCTEFLEQLQGSSVILASKCHAVDSLPVSAYEWLLSALQIFPFTLSYFYFFS